MQRMIEIMKFIMIKNNYVMLHFIYECNLQFNILFIHSFYLFSRHRITCIYTVSVRLVWLDMFGMEYLQDVL